MNKLNYKLQYIILMFVGSLLSCSNDDTRSIVAAPIQESSVEIKSSYNLLDYTPNVYHDYFKPTEHSVGFSSLKGNSLAEHSVVERINIKDPENKVGLFINNRSIDSLSISRKVSKVNSSDIYGKTVRFYVNTDKNILMKTSNTSSDALVELYVPDLVEITNPKINKEEELLPTCYYKDFVLEWSADPKNKEGLVIIAEYFGNNVIPKNATQEHILNTDVIKIDDGHAILNNDLFKDIPNLSYVDLILLRGNVTIKQIKGEAYKFFAESHVRLPIVLVKDLKTIAKE